MASFLSLVVCVVGALVFVFAKNNADAKKLGEYAYWIGLAVFLFLAGTQQVVFFK